VAFAVVRKADIAGIERSHNAVVVILAFALENVIDFGIALVDVIAYFTVFLETAETEQAPLAPMNSAGRMVL
jgi:hypothetical protein